MKEHDNSPRLSKRDIILVVFKRKRVFFSIFIFTTLLVIIGSYVVPLPYKATAKIYVERGKSPIVTSISLPTIQYLAREEVLNSEIEIMGSRVVAERVVRELNLHENFGTKSAISMLVKVFKRIMYFFGLLDELEPMEASILTVQKKVKVKPAPKSDIIKISYIGDDPKLITEVVNTLIDTYLDRRVELFKTMGTKGFYTKQADLFKKKIEELRHEEQLVKAKWSIGQIKTEREGNQNQIENLETQLRSSRKKYIEIVGKIKGLEKSSSYVPFDERDGRYHLVDEMGSSLLELEMRKSSLGQEFKEDSQQIQGLKNQIKELQNSILESLNSIRQGLALRVDTIASQISLLEKQKQTFNKQESRLNALASSIQIAESSYSQYVSLQEQARLDEMGDVSLVNVKVLDYATVPPKPIFPKIVFMFLGAFISIVTAYGVILAMEYFDHTIDSIEDIEYSSNLRVFAVIPEISELPKEIL